MQHERRFAAVIGLRIELRFTFIEQDCLGLTLARGAEHDAAIGQVMRRDIMAFFGDDVGQNQATQRVCAEKYSQTFQVG